MTVRRKKNSIPKTTARRKTGTAKSSSNRWLARWFRKLAWSVLLGLALYGAHSALARWVPGYEPAVRRTAQRVAQSAGDGMRRMEKELAPTPTITIHAPKDLAGDAYDNLSVGVPGWNCDVILDRQGYALGYSEKYEQPLWVSYRLTADEVRNKKAKRSDNFRADPAILSGSAELQDYKGAPFDRGHLAPAGDMTFSVQAMSESFLLSNMSPQQPEFNRGIWKELESKVRDFAVGNGSLYVVSGPIFIAGRETITIGANRVAVPHAYYKVLLDNTEPELKAIGFILPNAESKKTLSEFAVTVDAVERATGLDFFNGLAPELERKLESECDYSRWDRSAKLAHP